MYQTRGLSLLATAPVSEAVEVEVSAASSPVPRPRGRVRGPLRPHLGRGHHVLPSAFVREGPLDLCQHHAFSYAPILPFSHHNHDGGNARCAFFDSGKSGQVSVRLTSGFCQTHCNGRSSYRARNSRHGSDGRHYLWGWSIFLAAIVIVSPNMPVRLPNLC